MFQGCEKKVRKIAKKELMTSLDSKMFEAFQVAFVCFFCVCHSSWGKIKIHSAPEQKSTTRVVKPRNRDHRNGDPVTPVG